MDQETVKTLREWIILDNQIRTKKEELKQLTEQRNVHEDTIKTVLKEKHMQNNVIKIQDGSIRFVEKNNAQSLSLKYLKDQLDQYFRDRQQGPVDVDDLYRTLANNRKVTKVMEMIRDIQ